jgi:hypothetical protein
MMEKMKIQATVNPWPTLLFEPAKYFVKTMTRTMSIVSATDVQASGLCRPTLSIYVKQIALATVIDIHEPVSLLEAV